MYFNEEKSNTSIDKELSENTILSKIKRNLKKIIIIFIILILLIIAILTISNLLKNNKVNFKLLGDNSITLMQDEEYIDPGYIATDRNGNDISNEVKIEGEVDTSTIGEYTITYKLRTTRIQRIVKVEKREMPTINLKGDKIITLKLNEKYIEPGYTCTDPIDGDITDKVKVTSEVNSSKIGAYKIIYTVTNSGEQTVTVSRVVIIE